MRRLAALAVVLAACKSKPDCDGYLDELSRWGNAVDDRLAQHHVPTGVELATAGAPLDPLAGDEPRYDVTRDGFELDGHPLGPEAGEAVAAIERLARPVVVVAAADAPWWRIVVAVAHLEDMGVHEVRFVALGEAVARPPRTDFAKFPLPDDTTRLDKFTAWGEKIVERCPSFGALTWPQRDHDATPHEMAMAAVDCRCEVNPVEISSWLGYVTPRAPMGLVRAKVHALDHPPTDPPATGLDAYVTALRARLTETAAGAHQLAAAADTPWRDVLPKLVRASDRVELRILGAP